MFGKPIRVNERRIALIISLHTCDPDSDGTSRTGAYILIDMVLNRMAKGELSHTNTHLFRILFNSEIFWKDNTVNIRWLCRDLQIATHTDVLPFLDSGRG